MAITHHHITLLAPAKNLAVGRAAIDAGADAVYIGGPAFGARKAAGNSVEDIAALCRYAHLFRAHVHVTLNTLLRSEAEMQEAVRLSYAYRAVGVDAILVQDMRLARYLLATGHFADHCRLHASTQCDNRTLSRVQELEQMGFEQVVLARELSYQEIAAIRRETHCRLEAFVHGALCVSYSGACYLSEAVCGRSANRGECAQLCRQAYDVLDADQRPIRHPEQGMLLEKHALSLCDLDRSDDLEQLIEAGVSTLKIEGRLKDEDYVRNVVAHYRQRLDALGARGSLGRCYRSFTPAPEKTFHRGATTYFAQFHPGDPTSRPAHLVNMLTPKSTGEYLGRAPEALSLLHNGDGVLLGSRGCNWPQPGLRVPAGTPVYRNYDADFQRQLAAKDACRRVLPISLLFVETKDGFALTVSDAAEASDAAARSATVTLPAEHVPAANPERAEAVVRQQLSKLGGTPLEADVVTIRWSQPAFLPAAALNDLRRRAVEAFLATAETIDVPDVAPAPLPAFEPTDGELPAALMTCRYCLLYELGCCKRRIEAGQPVPTYLRGQNGLLLRVETNCRDCEMKIYRV